MRPTPVDRGTGFINDVVVTVSWSGCDGRGRRSDCVRCPGGRPTKVGWRLRFVEIFGRDRVWQVPVGVAVGPCERTAVDSGLLPISREPPVI